MFQMRKYLLFLIEEYPALWRQTHPYFREKATQRRAWEEILSAMKRKYDEQLLDHQLSTVAELMGAFKWLKSRLAQVEKANKKTTGMSANALKPITWQFYHAMEFLRQVSEPLQTHSTADSMENAEGDNLTSESTSSGPKWDPAREKQRRSILVREKKEQALSQEQEMNAKKKEEVLSTLSIARETLDALGKKKERKEKRKRDADRVPEVDEDDAFAKLLAIQTRQMPSRKKREFFAKVQSLVPDYMYESDDN